MTSNVGVAGINASADRHNRTQSLHQLGHLLKRAAQREFSAGGVLYQNGQTTLREIEFVAGRGNGGCGLE